MSTRSRNWFLRHSFRLRVAKWRHQQCCFASEHGVLRVSRLHSVMLCKLLTQVCWCPRGTTFGRWHTNAESVSTRFVWAACWRIHIIPCTVCFWGCLLLWYFQLANCSWTLLILPKGGNSPHRENINTLVFDVAANWPVSRHKGSKEDVWSQRVLRCVRSEAFV